MWWNEAGKYNVLPLDGRGVERAAEYRPVAGKPRDQYVYYPDTQNVPENAAVRVLNRDHSITAEVTIPDDGAEGVLLAHGSQAGGYTVFVQDDRLHYVHNYVGAEEYQVSADEPLPTGEVELRMEFEATGDLDMAHGKGVPATVRLYYDDEQVGEGDLPTTTPNMIGTVAGVSCGYDAINAVSDEYRDHAPFGFTGDITRVTVDVSGEPFVDQDAMLENILARESGEQPNGG